MQTISSDTIRRVAAEMYEELSGVTFTVAKWRKEDVWIRGAIVTNPEWYQRFCKQHEAPRKRYPKPRTKIKKEHTLRALDRIARGLPCSGMYYECLMEIIVSESEFREAPPHLLSKEAKNHACVEQEAGRTDSDW